MARNLHLRIARGRFIFRRRVPLGLRVRFGKVEIVKAVEAADFRSAQRTARHYATVTDRLFLMASQDSSLTPGQLEILARQYFDDVVAFHEYRYQKLGVLEPEEREKEMGAPRHSNMGVLKTRLPPEGGLPRSGFNWLSDFFGRIYERMGVRHP